MSHQNPHAKRPASLRPQRSSPSTALGRTSLALGLSTAMLMPAPAAAAGEDAELETVTVVETALEANPYAEPGVPYKAAYSGDDRHKRPLAETPQNISVLTKAQIEDSGLTDLREILDAQPGITLGTGENGNAFGDRYVIRGQEARSDVFVDGIRDPGMSIRESFATEQVEISKGPNSSFAGRGTAGGAINTVTKMASTLYDFTRLSTGFGSDQYTRLTLDANKVVSDTLALRANLLFGHEEVPDRAPADRERKGAAITGSWKATERLNVTLDYYGLRAEDKPDLGSYLVGSVPDRRPTKNVPAYAQDPDFLRSDVDILTARLSYQIAPELRLTNLSRIGTADNAYVVTGASAATTHSTNATGVYDTTTLSTHQGWQEVDYKVNQTNLHWDKEFGGLLHEFIFGLEVSDHSVVNGVFDVSNSGQNCTTTGRSGAPGAAWCITDGDGNLVNGVNTLMNRQIARGTWDVDWNVKTTSLSAMDTVDLNERWTAFGGLRYDHFDFDTTTQNTRTLARTRYAYADDLYNGHLGLTYKFRPDANVYVSYATASDINGGESDVGASCGYGGVCVDDAAGVTVAGSKPETTESIELGTKWNLMGGKLLATAAAFQITKRDVMEQSPNSTGYTSTGSQNTGKNRVRGVELGLSGELTRQLTAQAGIALMNAEVLESNVAENVGKTLSNFADHTAFAQLKYQASAKLSFGTVVKYEGRKYAGQPDSAAGYQSDGAYSQPIPAYTVVDLFANYRFDRNLDMRVNIGNVFDKDYYLAGYRSGSFIYLGDARNLRVTLSYDF